jgi:hypothetical protein
MLFFRSHGTFLQAFSMPLISLLLFVICVFAIGSIYFSAPMFPLRSEITQVTVVDIDPLILSLNVKAITSRETRIESALVLNDNEIVAQIPSDEKWAEWVQSNHQPFTLAELPAGSEISLTLDFNTTLPSGDYLVILSSWHNDHGSSPFTIP